MCSKEKTNTDSNKVRANLNFFFNLKNGLFHFTVLTRMGTTAFYLGSPTKQNN